MQIVLQVIFWFCILLMLHSYVVFPFLLHLLSSGKKGNTTIYNLSRELPHLYILMSVFNEQNVIKEKLESVFATSYPLDKIFFYIGSDNSSDDTNQIIHDYSEKYSQIRFFPFSDRRGKSGVLNKLYDEIARTGISDSDIFILTDANVMFTRDCLYEMTKHFKNHSIGQVAANILNKGQKQKGISNQESSYIQRENRIKYQEGLIWGAMQGAFGACYAMRADCFTHIPPNFLMEDFYISMNILQKGKKAISELKAICYEDVSDEVSEEFKRKTRISTGNYQNLSIYWPMMFRFDAVAFCLFSHKVIRWAGPFIIILIWISSVFLSISVSFYLLACIGLSLSFMSPLLDRLLEIFGIRFAILRYVSYFYLMNIALLYGLYKYINGTTSSAWNPTKRNV